MCKDGENLGGRAREEERMVIFKGKSGKRGTKTSGKGLESWFRNETRNVSFQQ